MTLIGNDVHCGTLKLPRNPDALGGGALEQGASEATELTFSSKTFFSARLVGRLVVHDRTYTTIDGVENGDTLLDRAQFMGYIAAPQWDQPSAADHPQHVWLFPFRSGRNQTCS